MAPCTNRASGPSRKQITLAISSGGIGWAVEKDTVFIDARPSDALVMAAQEGVPIYVDDEVLSQAGKWALEPKMGFSIQDLEHAFGEEFQEFDNLDDDEEQEDDKEEGTSDF